MKRVVVLVAALAMQICLGGIYAWSSFAQPLQSQYGFTATQTQLVFGTAIAVLAIAMIFTGRLQDRFHPRPVAICGGMILLVGYQVTASLGKDFLFLWLGSGFLTGLGIGCGYVCAISTSVKWFPRHKGVVTGIVVGAYGGGAIILSAIIESLLKSKWDVFEIISVVGLIYSSIVIIASTLLFIPIKTCEAHNSFSYKKILTDRRFWQMFIVFLCGGLPGLMIVGNLKSIGLALGANITMAAMAISVFAAGNMGGRLLWGILFDKFGAKWCVIISMMINFASLVGLFSSDRHQSVFLASVLFVGVAYASCLVLHAAQVAKIYGLAIMGSVYPLVLVSQVICALVGAPLGGLSSDLTGSYMPALVLAGVIVLVGLMIYIWLDVKKPQPQQVGQELVDDRS